MSRVPQAAGETDFSDRGSLRKNIALPLLTVAIAASCAIWTLTRIHRYGVSIPFWDEWDFVKIMRELSSGDLSWPQALVLRGGEHQLFSQFAYSAVAWHLSHLHLKTVMVWNWCVAASFCLLAALVTGRELGGDKTIAWLTLAASSFFVFNPAGYQVMLWALPPVYSLLSLSFLIGVYLAQSRMPAGIKIVGAGLLSLFASFILGNGLLFWVALPAVLLLYEDFQRVRQSRVSLLIFAALLSLAIAGYVAGSIAYSGPPGAGSGLNAIVIGLFFLALTGNFVSLSLTPQPVHLAQAAGALIILLFAVATAVALRGRTGERRKIVLVWVFFGFFWLLSGLSAAIARHAFGIPYALNASRYVTASSFFLLATLVLAATALKDLAPALPDYRKLYSSLVAAVAILLCTAIVCRYPQARTANSLMENSRYSQLQGKTAANGSRLLESPAFRNIFPHTDFAEFAADVRFLNSRGWLRPPLWDERFLRHLSDLTPNATCGALDSATRAGNSVQLQGWDTSPIAHSGLMQLLLPVWSRARFPESLE